MRFLGFLVFAFPFFCFAANDCSELVGTFKSKKDNQTILKIEKVGPKSLRINQANWDRTLQTDSVLRRLNDRDSHLATAVQAFCRPNGLTEIYVDYMYIPESDRMGFLTNDFNFDLDSTGKTLTIKRDIHTSDGTVLPQGEYLFERVN